MLNLSVNQCIALKHDGPTPVLTTLRTLQETYPDLEVWRENRAYLEKRETQMHALRPTFQAQGWPIGSGAVESSHTVMVEARLNGAGMHWAREHVNPMVALRNAVCNDRWDEAWAQIATHLRQHTAHQRRTRPLERRTQPATVLPPAVPVSLPSPEPAPALVPSPTPAPGPAPESPAVSDLAAGPPQPYRPGPDHPWRRSPIGRARYQSAQSVTSAKT